MHRKSFLKFPAFLAAFLLAAALLLSLDGPVFAEEVSPSEETAAEAQGEDHSSFSSEMLMAARNRYGLNSRTLLRNAAADAWEHSGKILEEASLPYTGNAYVVAFHIDFPDQAFAEGDTEEALQSALGMDLNKDPYPVLSTDQYASLYGYYQRASYGKLSIAGETFSYTAKKNRSDYESSKDLLVEVMDALDADVDFSRYDANDDYLIDAIYLHIPYNSGDEWATTWWPNCGSLVDADLEYDGVRVASRVVISRQLDGREGRQTLIHESGHAMGFPDYYSYDKASYGGGGDNQLTGILSFDMMDTDVGDHNGFSKWIAGWLEDSDVTIVNANAEGVSATRGGESVGTADGKYSLTLDLASFDSEDPTKTGGIIVVGNDVQTPFAKYFLIQYDTFAGNQKVYYYKDGEAQALPSGFRVFRVQADLNEYGQLRHDNTTDALYDKLIELVDPDYKVDHTFGSYDSIPQAFGGEDYDCMFYAGSSLTPTSKPSSNFCDDIDIGFTGITIDFLEIREGSGTLRISYSEDDKPVEKPFELTLDDCKALPGGFQVTLRGTRNLIVDAPSQISIALKENDEYVYSDYTRSYQPGGKTLTAFFHLDTDLLTKDRTVLIRCGRYAFNTGIPDYYYPSFSFEIPIDPAVVDLSASGYIEGSATPDLAHTLSLIRREEDGTYYFYGYSGGYLPTNSTDIYRYTFKEDDPTDVTATLLEAGSEERKDASLFFLAMYDDMETEAVADLPDNAQLGDYPVVLDAVKIGDSYYTVSFREPDYSTMDFQNRMAVSRLDADGKLLEQILPAGNEIPQKPETSSRARILIGPNGTIAVLLFRPSQMRDYQSNDLSAQMAAFFFDQELNLVGRLDNYSTGCGIWLEDGRFIAFGQRNRDTDESYTAGIPRTDLICYDITGVIDPEVIEYTAANEDGSTEPVWESGSSDGLQIAVHRNIHDEKAKDLFRGAQVDGNTLTEGTDYTVRFASVHISLQPAYLETLTEGPHTLTVLFEDGQAEITFEISKEAETEPESSTEPASTQTPDQPATGDRSQPLLWIILMAAALLLVGAAVVMAMRKRTR